LPFWEQWEDSDMQLSKCTAFALLDSNSSPSVAGFSRSASHCPTSSSQGNTTLDLISSLQFRVTQGPSFFRLTSYLTFQAQREML
jgi:hypothetical protein